jgi:dUTP pyrophosphatase
MERDEQALVNIGTMAGTTKTVNANGHNIIGNQHAGVTLADGQTLTINDANVEGFYKEDGTGGSFIDAQNGTLYVNNSIFRNNATLNDLNGDTSGGAIRAFAGEIVDSSFYNNIAIRTEDNKWPEGGAISGAVNVYAKTKDSIFEGNYGIDGGGAYSVYGDAEIKGLNGHKVIFSNNESNGGGGLIAYRNLSHVVLDNVEFKAHSITVLDTGVCVELPEGYAGLLAMRSSVCKTGLIIQQPLIDENYRGEIHIIVFNPTNRDFAYNEGDRVCSLYIFPVYHQELEVVDELSESNRGDS